LVKARTVIIPGKRLENKTRIYLSPCLKDWGTQLEMETYQNYPLAFGIGDKNYSEEIPGHIFILFDTNGKRKYGKYPQKQRANFKFGEYLEFIREHEAYVTDYLFDGVQDGHQHMVVLKIPQEYIDSDLMGKFLSGSYSEMYTEEQKEKLFSKTQFENQIQVDNPSYMVINKSEQFEEKFKQKLVEDFDVPRPTYDISDREWDYKPYLPEEVFNYEG